MKPSQDAREAAEEAVSAANIVSHDGYYEADIDAVTAVFARFEAHLRSTSPVGEVGEMVERLRKAAKPGVGAAADWSDSECADYWSHIAVTGRTLHAEAAAMLERLAASDTEAMRLLRELSEAVDALPVEEMVDRDRYGNPELLGYCMQAQGEWDRVREVRARIDALAKGGASGDTEAMLSDPNAVHVNLVAGRIARPSVAQIIHIYGEKALRDALAKGGAA